MSIYSVVEAKNLRKSYNSLEAVGGVSFNMLSGRCYGILGPNGAGKTTLIAMIHCFLSPTSGSLTVLGLNVSTEHRQIKYKSGVVPQENNLDVELTVMENLIVYGHYFDIAREEAKARAERLLNFFQLTDKRNVSVEHLSGGMKRKLILARALINNPQLLILDEPTTGLDPEARQQMWQFMRRLKGQGMSIILTTHYMEEAAHLCDDLFIMDKGKIIEKGCPSELVEKHIGPYVLEIEVEASREGEFLSIVRERTHSFQKRGSTYYLYLDEEEHFNFQSSLQYCGITYQLLRPANLEDVFLTLTGRKLSNHE